MPAGARAVVDLHARAFNAHDLDTMASGVVPAAPTYRDGQLLGQGPGAARRALTEEYATHHAAAGTVMELRSGERAMVEWSDAERGGEMVGVMRFVTDGDRIQAIRIDHDRDLVRRLVGAGRRFARHA